MLLYSWKKVKEEGRGSVYRTYLIIQYLLKGRIPTNRFDPTYPFYGMDLKGKSFLANPSALYDNMHKFSKAEVVEYVALASRRSVGDYIATGKLTLNLKLANKTQFNNRLLYVKDEEIHFIYEDLKRKY